MSDEEWEQVAQIGVDAGMVWVGDPCYTMTPDTSFAIAENWQDFVARVFDGSEIGWRDGPSPSGATSGLWLNLVAEMASTPFSFGAIPKPDTSSSFASSSNHAPEPSVRA
jgi:hypothetical protein